MQEITSRNAREFSGKVGAAVWLSLLVALATVLRVFALGDKSFWLDEAVSSMLARADWHTFAAAVVARQSNMALYYFLLRAWTHLGISDTWLRLLSVAFGVAAVPMMYQVARQVVSDKAARIAALLIAIHAFHIQHSQEARGYSLLVFLALLSCYFFSKMRASGGLPTQVAYIVCSSLMIYAHMFGSLLLAAQWACAFLLPNAARVRKAVLVSAGVVSLSAAPLIYAFVASDRSQLSWMNAGSAPSFYQFSLDLAGDNGSSVLILYLALLLLSLWTHFHRPQPAQRAPIAYVFIWVWMLLPIAVVAIISLYRPILQSRYLILCLPAFLILAADGLSALRSRALFGVAALTIAAFSLAGVNSYFRARMDPNRSDNWRDATHYCLSQAQSGDAVLFPYSAEEIAFRDYQDRLQTPGPGLAFIPPKTKLDLLSTAGSWTSPELASLAASQHKRVWLITALQPNAHSDQVRAVLRASLREEAHRNFGFVRADLFAGGAQ